MRDIEFKGKEYQIPEKWEEVSLRMIIKAAEMDELLDDSPIVAILHGYTGIPLDELKLSNMAEINDILTVLEFIYDEYKPVPNNCFEFNGETFCTKPDIADVNFEDWISVQTVLFNNKDNQILALPKLIATFFKKPNETLDDFDLTERAEYLLDLPFPLAKNAEGFFLSQLIVSQGYTQLYSIVESQEKLILSMLEELLNIISKRKEQSGISWLTRLVLGVYLRYIKSLKRGLERYFRSGHTKSSKKSFSKIWKRLVIKRLKRRVSPRSR